MKTSSRKSGRILDQVFAPVWQHPTLTPAAYFRHLEAVERGCIKALANAEAWDEEADDINPSAVIPKGVTANRKNNATALALRYLHHAALCLHAIRRLKSLLATGGDATVAAQTASLMEELLAEMKRAPRGVQLERVIREHNKNTRSANLYRATKAAFKTGKTEGRLSMHGAFLEAAKKSKGAICPAKTDEALRALVMKWRREGYL